MVELGKVARRPLEVARAGGWTAPSSGCGSGRCALGHALRRGAARREDCGGDVGHQDGGCNRGLGAGGTGRAELPALQSHVQVGREEAQRALGGGEIIGPASARRARNGGHTASGGSLGAGSREGALRPAHLGLAGRRATPRGRAAKALGRGEGAAQPPALGLDAAWVQGQ